MSNLVIPIALLAVLVAVVYYHSQHASALGTLWAWRLCKRVCFLLGAAILLVGGVCAALGTESPLRVRLTTSVILPLAAVVGVYIFSCLIFAVILGLVILRNAKAHEAIDSATRSDLLNRHVARGQWFYSLLWRLRGHTVQDVVGSVFSNGADSAKGSGSKLS